MMKKSLMSNGGLGGGQEWNEDQEAGKKITIQPTIR